MGHFGQTTVTDTAEATVTVAPPADVPAISIVNTADPTSLQVGGGDVTYTYVVENTGNVPVFDVHVRDDNGTSGDTSDDFDVTCPKDTLAVGESMTCTATVNGITANTTNVGTATADWDSCHDDCRTAVTPATDDATVTVAPPGGGAGGETNVPVVPTAPSTDTLASGTAGDASGTLPLLLIVLGVIGLGAVLLTPKRERH
jgi:NAD-dependent dihydropyrimidine dehydrogenase PreA subunit